MKFKIGDLIVIVEEDGTVGLVEDGSLINLGEGSGLRFNVVLQALNLAKNICKLNSYADDDVKLGAGEQ